ncbi:MAG: hypothetical protein M1481_02150 [Candidatus Thermoplasmatota archaeon]|jgi:hypothetical protein|nr:hypothetical protein [Candidatus Thermoplasmatota archaeon]MCL5962747.1 hypothetical protein [Candidatus Thermoplasmatota archaeon]
MSSLSIVNFITVLVFSFSIFIIVAGAFTTYFGSGKSKAVGIILMLVGVVIGIAFGYYYIQHYPYHLINLIEQSLEVIVAALIGLLIAFGLFLFAIMKT